MTDRWNRGLPPAGDPPGWLVAALCVALLAALAWLWADLSNLPRD
ncbi:hypothetical protein [Xanthomonas translucens]|nr:hypothetical protein [Xanthomonas translucens]